MEKEIGRETTQKEIGRTRSGTALRMDDGKLRGGCREGCGADALFRRRVPAGETYDAEGNRTVSGCGGCYEAAGPGGVRGQKIQRAMIRM